jgi:dihydrofolate synthase/folylpolyglutamate synthase
VEVVWRHPTVILDTAHTVESVRSLAGALRTHCPDSSPWFLFGCSGDKNVSGMMGILAERCRGLTATAADYPRAMPPEDIARAARQAGIGHVRVATPPARALRTLQAESSPDDLVCVTGSFYVAGEVRSLWVGEGGR